MDEIGQFISTVGFPVAVASFLLWRMNGKMDKLTRATERQARATEKLTAQLEKEHKARKKGAI